MTCEELLRNINRGNIASGYIFEGGEDALKMDAVLRIRDKIGARLVFDEKDAFQEDIFSEKKIVVLRGLSKIELIKNTPPSIIPIVFVEKIENIQTQTPIVSFPKLYGERLKFWIKERFKEHGRIITEPAINLLITSTGGDISSLIQEIEKITLFSDKKWLNDDDISPIICKIFNKNIFALLDAIGERKMEALSICSFLISYGASYSHILFMIEKRLSEIFLLKDKKEINPWQYKKISRYKRLFSDDEMYFLFSKLADCDLKLKSYSSNSRPLILLSLIYNIVKNKNYD